MTTSSFRKPEEVPGGYGWPVVGWLWGLLDFFFVRGWSRFFTDRQRRHRSDVFRVNLFQPTIAVLDLKAIETLFKEEGVAQDHGFSWAVPNAALVGDILPSIFMSAPEHDQYKALYMKMLGLRSKELIATFNGTAELFGSRWTKQASFSFETEIEDFASTLLFKWYFDLAPDPLSVRKLYLGLFSHVFTPITRHIPWSNYRRSLATFEDLLQQVKLSPRFQALLPLAHDLGLTDDDETAKQLLFVTGMNSFLGTQNLVKSVVGELSARVALANELRGEIAKVTALGPITSFAQLSNGSMPLLDKTLREILRVHPPVTLIFGRLQSDRQLDTLDGRAFQLRRGELLMGVLPLAMMDPCAYPRPDEFDPERFQNPSASEHLIWSRGRHDLAAKQSDRTCPGKDVSILLAKLVCVWLLPRYRWTLDQAPRWDSRRFSLNVAAPVGPMMTNDFQVREGA